MALIGLYVGRDPGRDRDAVAALDARGRPALGPLPAGATVGLLAFLGIEALLEGTRARGQGPAGVRRRDARLGGRRGGLPGAGGRGRLATGGGAKGSTAGSAEATGYRAAFLVALGIGLHNLGEGLAIGSAYAIGSLALGAALVVGFALHNTTEGLAIVAPVARGGGARLGRLAGLGLLAGAPAMLGAWIGASAYDPKLAAFMFGVGAGAIAQVIVQIAPSVRDRAGRLLNPLAAAGMLAGLIAMYATGLLVSI